MLLAAYVLIVFGLSSAYLALVAWRWPSNALPENSARRKADLIVRMPVVARRWLVRPMDLMTARRAALPMLGVAVALLTLAVMLLITR